MTKPVTIGPHRDTPLLWLRRSVARYTDGGPRLSGLVVGDRPAVIVDQNPAAGWETRPGVVGMHFSTNPKGQDGTCKCGYHVCSGKGPCAPQIEAGYIERRVNLALYLDHKGTFSAVCTRCGWQSGMCTTEAGLLALYDAKHACPKERILKQDITSDTYRCTDCAWRSGRHGKATSQLPFDAHDCAEWPEGTMGIQMTCPTHGDSPPFPTHAKADAWMDGHAECVAEVGVPRPFVVGDKVRVVASLNRGWPVGRMGTVGDIDSGGFLRVDIGGNSNFHPPHELEHVT